VLKDLRDHDLTGALKQVREIREQADADLATLLQALDVYRKIESDAGKTGSELIHVKLVILHLKNAMTIISENRAQALMDEHTLQEALKVVGRLSMHEAAKKAAAGSLAPS
jgi:hydrogenase maturation factor